MKYFLKITQDYVTLFDPFHLVDSRNGWDAVSQIMQDFVQQRIPVSAPLFAFHCFYLLCLFLCAVGIKPLVCFKSTVLQVLLLLSEALYVSWLLENNWFLQLCVNFCCICLTSFQLLSSGVQKWRYYSRCSHVSDVRELLVKNVYCIA